MSSRSIRLFLLAVSVSGTLAAQTPVSASAPKAPETATREVTDDYFGVKIVDPYRWLEDVKSPDVAAWMKAQNDYTHAVLDRIPGRDKLRPGSPSSMTPGFGLAASSPSADAGFISSAPPARTIRNSTRGMA